jgi:ubiquinone/menaquinone biosynthesis C-methylase UbiE
VARLAAQRVTNWRVVGKDINSRMLAIVRSLAQADGPRVERYEASTLEMPFPDESFDLVPVSRAGAVMV